MANEQNLIPLGSGKRSEKEEREMRSRGGKKSGETRRKKTAMKKVANLLLNMPVSEEAYPTIINTLQKMGFEDDMITNQTAMLVSMWREAMDKKLSDEEAERHWTIQKNAYIVRGQLEVAGQWVFDTFSFQHGVILKETIEDLAKLRQHDEDFVTITEYADNTLRGTDRTKHWRIGGA